MFNAMPVEIMGWSYRFVDMSYQGNFHHHLYIFRKHEGGLQYIGKDFKTYKTDKDEKLEPVIKIESHHIEGIFEALWESGMRPKSRNFKEEMKLKDKEIEAIKNHLEDLKKILFSKLLENADDKQTQLLLSEKQQ